MLDKISKVFGKKNFKGEGHRLGTADDNKDRTPASSSGQGKNRPNSQKLGTEKKSAVQPFVGRPQKLTPTPASSGAPTRTSVARSPPAVRPDGDGAQPPAPSPPEQLLEARPAAAPEAPAPALALLDPEVARSVASEELQSALAQLDSGPEDPRRVLKKLLVNILQKPEDTKYRRIRLGNPTIQAAIVDADGPLELLQACGFQVLMEDGEEGKPGEAFAILPEDDDLLQMKAALVLLGYTNPPAEPSPAPAPAAPREPRIDSLALPCDRETQVVLPSGPNAAAQVEDWVFKRTPAELKNAMLEARKKREQSEMMMTKATREKLQSGQKAVYKKSTVRVRLPEGLLLQGTFNAREPVAAIFDWVTDCLADPGTTYELVLPDRKPLVTAMGTLQKADLLPNVLLMFRSDDRHQSPQTLTVRQELLKSSV